MELFELQKQNKHEAISSWVQVLKFSSLDSFTGEASLGEFWALLCSCVRWVQLCSSLNILWHCLSLGFWRRKWQPIPVLLPGKFHGRRSLIGYSPWGHKESDTTEWLHFLWDWNENGPFPFLWPLRSFPNLLPYWVQHFHSIIFQDLKQLNWNFVTSTSFVRSDAF